MGNTHQVSLLRGPHLVYGKNSPRSLPCEAHICSTGSTQPVLPPVRSTSGPREILTQVSLSHEARIWSKGNTQVSLPWSPHLVQGKYSPRSLSHEAHIWSMGNTHPGLSPMKPASGPRETLSHPSPQLLSLLTDLTAAELSELCHQSIALGISFLFTTDLWFYTSGGQVSKISFTGLNSRCWQGCDTSEVAEETDHQFLAFSSFWRFPAFLGSRHPTSIITPPLILLPPLSKGSF